MRQFAALAVLLASLTILPAWGCGSASSQPHAGITVPVKGKVTYKGEPLSRGSIRFEPDGGGREAQASIEKDGSFVLTTFSPQDGAFPGTHRVAVTGNTARGDAVPIKFRNPSSSKVEVEVTESKSDYPIDLK